MSERLCGSWEVTNQILIKIYLFAKDPHEAKYQLLVNKQESAGLKQLNYSKAFIECPNYMNDIYNNIKEYNSNKQRKTLIIFDDMIAYMLSNKKLNPIVAELFIRGRKLSISLVFLHNLILPYQENRLNSTHYFIMKIPNKQELQQTAFNYSSDINFIDFMNL